ncbi:MAG: hypothetical protein V4725_01845 [Bacteroidota bacterium]
MKFFISFLLLVALSVTACLFLPWWIIGLVAFIVAAIIPQRPIHSFLCSFLSLFITWGGLAGYLSAANDHILAHKISVVILTRDSPFILILATMLIGGLVAGFGGLAGSYIHPRYREEEKIVFTADHETKVI